MKSADQIRPLFVFFKQVDKNLLTAVGLKLRILEWKASTMTTAMAIKVASQLQFSLLNIVYRADVVHGFEPTNLKFNEPMMFSINFWCATDSVN